jgi:hypothetical protein
MSTVGRAMTSRLRGRPQAPREDYAFCPEDRFWFRPSYTEGKCPLCGAIAVGGASSAPLLLRTDRSWLGVGVLVLESLVMLTLVLVFYFKG